MKNQLIDAGFVEYDIILENDPVLRQNGSKKSLNNDVFYIDDDEKFHHSSTKFLF